MNILDQNNRITLERLSAYDNHYSKAQFFSRLRLAVCVVIPVAMAVFKLWYNTRWFTNLLLIYCAFACLLWFLLSKWVGRWRHVSAKVLQLVEVELLGTEWNPYFCGSKPLPEEIYFDQKQDVNCFRNWFGIELEQQNLDNAILMAFKKCMDRIMLGRDRHFAISCWCMAALEALVVLSVIFIDGGYNLNGFLTYTIVPSVPLWLWFSSLNEQRKRSNNQLAMIAKMIEDERSNGNSTQLNNLIQNYLFLYRDEAWVREW